MAHRYDYGPDKLSQYEDPELQKGLAKLDRMRRQRARIAQKAAHYIVERCGGETTDLQLYYAAMFGKGVDEGIAENDPNLLGPLYVARTMSNTQEGQPMEVKHSKRLTDVGVVGSFSAEEFDPIRFRVRRDDMGNGIFAWRGSMGVAMRRVLSEGAGDDRAYSLANDVSELAVYEATRWGMTDSLDVETGAASTVEVGRAVTSNGLVQAGKLHWLWQHLAPTERMEIPYEALRRRVSIREVRQEFASEQGISEAEAAAQSLSPPTANFFTQMRPYVTDEMALPIDTKALFQRWHDPYDAQSRLGGLELRELVELDENDQPVVSELGREALRYL